MEARTAQLRNGGAGVDFVPFRAVQNRHLDGGRLNAGVFDGLKARGRFKTVKFAFSLPCGCSSTDRKFWRVGR